MTAYATILGTVLTSHAANDGLNRHWTIGNTLLDVLRLSNLAYELSEFIYHYPVSTLVGVRLVIVAIKVFCKSDGSNRDLRYTEKNVGDWEDQCGNYLHAYHIQTHIYIVIYWAVVCLQLSWTDISLNIKCKELDFTIMWRRTNYDKW